MKQQITHLVRAFKAIALTVDLVVQSFVNPFIETMKTLSSSGEDPNRATRVGSLTLTDLQRSQVYAATLIIRSYVSLFGGIAEMYARLSMDCIFPGLRMCDELSMLSGNRDSDSMKRRVEALNRWAVDASKRISETVRQKQEETREDMGSKFRRRVTNESRFSICKTRLDFCLSCKTGNGGCRPLRHHEQKVSDLLKLYFYKLPLAPVSYLCLVLPTSYLAFNIHFFFPNRVTRYLI